MRAALLRVQQPDQGTQRDVHTSTAMARRARGDGGGGHRRRDLRPAARRGGRAGPPRRPHRRQRPGLHRRRPGGGRGRGGDRRAHLRRGHQTGDRGDAWPIHRGRGRRRRHRRARLQRQPRPLRQRIAQPDRARPGRRAHARGGAAAHPRLRREEPVGAVDPRPRLELLGLPGRAADPGPARRRARRPAGDAGLLRRPQLVGQQQGARGRRHHPGHRRSAGRRHHPRRRRASPTACSRSRPSNWCAR